MQGIAAAAAPTDASAQRVRVVNSLRLVKHANLPQTTERLVCSFLELPELVDLPLLSKDMAALLQSYMAHMREARIAFGKADFAAVSPLRFCEQLRVLTFKQWDSYPRPAALDAALCDAVARNANSLQFVLFGTATRDTMRALAACRCLTRFQEENLGGYERSDEDAETEQQFARRAEFQREAVRVIRGNRRTLTELQLGQRRKSSALSVSTIHTILHHGLPLKSLSVFDFNADLIDDIARNSELQQLTLSVRKDHWIHFAQHRGLLSRLTALTSFTLEETLWGRSALNETAWQLPDSCTRLHLAEPLRVRATHLLDLRMPWYDGSEGLLELLAANPALTALKVAGMGDSLGDDTAHVLLQRTALTRLALSRHAPVLPPEAFARLPAALTRLRSLKVRVHPATTDADCIAALAGLKELQVCRLHRVRDQVDFPEGATEAKSALPAVTAAATLPALTRLELSRVYHESLALLRTPILVYFGLAVETSLAVAFRAQARSGKQQEGRPPPPLLPAGCSESLQVLVLEGCTWLDESALRALLATLPRLRVLACVHCWMLQVGSVSPDTLRLVPLLRALQLEAPAQWDSERVAQDIVALAKILPRLRCFCLCMDDEGDNDEEQAFARRLRELLPGLDLGLNLGAMAKPEQWL